MDGTPSVLTGGPGHGGPRGAGATPTGKETDLERLSQVQRAGFDRAFLKVLTTRHRTALRMATAEVRDGGLPESALSPSR